MTTILRRLSAAAIVVLAAILAAPAISAAQTTPWGTSCPGPIVAPYGACNCRGYFGVIANCYVTAQGNCGCVSPDAWNISCSPVRACLGLDHPPLLSAEVKVWLLEHASVLLGGAGAATAIAAMFCPATTVAILKCVAVLGTAAGLQALAGGALYVIGSVDPVDLEYKTVASLDPVPYAPPEALCNNGVEKPGRRPQACELTVEEAEILNSWFYTQSLIAAIGPAMAKTTDRRYTAAMFYDQAAVDLQTAAFRAYQGQLVTLLTTDVTLRTQLGTMLRENNRPWLDHFADAIANTEILAALSYTALVLQP